MTTPPRRFSKVLVLGGGAREHALARALARSPSVDQVLVAPGNAGTDEPAGPGRAPIRAVPITSLAGEPVVALARAEQPDLIVVGPEPPLCAGIVDDLAVLGIPVFGPDRRAARLEGSKAFVKDFAVRHGIPTSEHRVVTEVAAADEVIAAWGAPIVVKADGLCAGKGVVVAATTDEARAAVRAMLVERGFGDAGATVVIERFVPGRELSVHVLTDGVRHLTLPAVRDHKRLGTGDRGPNTGGMGAFGPARDLDPALARRIEDELIAPTIAGMQRDGAPFRGVLFAGVMVTPAGDPMLLEHNVRFGDPECQVLMELLDGDVAALLGSIAAGAMDLSAAQIAADRGAVTVVLATPGYPAAPEVGQVITGLAEAGAVPDVVVHHAGTRVVDGQIVTAGGRVLAVTARRPSVAAARVTAYQACARIDFAGAQLRTDIGASDEEPGG